MNINKVIVLSGNVIAEFNHSANKCEYNYSNLNCDSCNTDLMIDNNELKTKNRFIEYTV